MEVNAFIFNWRGHEDGACALVQQISRLCRTVVVNSDETLVDKYPSWVHLNETAYFAAQWRAALQHFEGDLLFHIQADASFGSFEHLLVRAQQTFQKYRADIYEPNINYTFFTYDVGRLVALEPDLYAIPLSDTTCWCLHRDLIEALPPLDPSLNKYGWGLAEVAAAIARKRNRLIVRDYTLLVNHPAGRGYPKGEAMEQRSAYLDTLPADVAGEVALVLESYLRLRGDEPRDSWPLRVWQQIRRLIANRTQG
jgi:hypothetical protein